jgi:hypothetical protein
MTFLLFGAALLGAWLVQPTLQVDHTPVVTPAGTPPTTADRPQPPATTTGGGTMH